jgi:hypothetical protein
MNARERAQAIITDILVNHLPRIKDGLEKGYVDENQILVVYDHAVRARVLQEYDFEADAATISAGIEHPDNLAKINRELEKEWQAEIAAKKQIEAQGETRGDIPPYDPATFTHPGEAEQDRRAMHGTKIVNVPAPGIPCGIIKQVDEIIATQPVPRSLIDEIQQGMAIIIARSELHFDMHYVQDIKPDGYPEFAHEKGRAKLFPVIEAKELARGWTNKYADMSFSAESVSDLNWKPHVEKHACICGGVIEDFPTGVETMLKCKQCGRTFLDEFELAEARKNETKSGQKCADATYWTTGTLLNGTASVPMETEINLNGRKTTIKAQGGKFVLTYEEIVRMAINAQRGHLNAFQGPDSELPNWTCVYHHRVEFSKLPGERSGSLYKGKSVECTPGMSIDCLSTSNA